MHLVVACVYSIHVRHILPTSNGSRTIRTLDYSYLGLFVPWTVRTLLDCSYHVLCFCTVLGLFVPWTVRTVDCS